MQHVLARYVFTKHQIKFLFENLICYIYLYNRRQHQWKMTFNNFQSKKLDEMIDTFKHKSSAKSEIEFEIRFSSPNEDTFKQIVEKFLSDHPKATSTVEQSISIMTDTDSSGFDRKEMYFHNGVQQKIDHNRKKREDMLKVMANNQEIYRIAVSSEATIPEFSMNLAHRIRLKLRCSIIPDKYPQWRYDFTAAVQLEKSQISQLKEYKQRMFPNKPVDAKTFLTSIPNIPGMRYEFEIEYVGKPAALRKDNVGQAIKYFTDYVNPNFEETSSYQGQIYELAKKLIDDKYQLEQFRTKNALKQLQNNPKNLTKAKFFNVILPNIENYYISDKADGERCFIYISFVDTPKIILVLADKAVDMTAILANKLPKSGGDIILDAEVVNIDRDHPEKSHPKIYLFDILMRNGSRVVSDPFEKRESYLDEFVPYLKNTEKKILKRLDAKTYGKTIREIFARDTRAYPIDGLVFTPAQPGSSPQKYHKPDYFSMVVYKWKDPEKLSIDFLILKPPTNILGAKPYLPKKGYELYFLFSGINMADSKVLNLPDIKGYREMVDGIPESGNYFPIQFSHAAYPYAYMYYAPESVVKEHGDLHQQIGEFVWNDKDSWKLDKLRPDKAILVKKGLAFGNNFRVAEEIFDNYLNPLTMDMMIDVSAHASNDYFQTEKSQTYKALTKYNNFVKAQLIKQLEGKQWVVDLAAGRGSDLFTYNGYGVQNILCMDIDQAALEELGNRSWNFADTHPYVFNKPPSVNARVYALQNDLFTPAAQTLETIESRGIPVPIGQVDGVVINLALHYIMTNEKALANVVTLVNKLLKPGGVFIFTTFDGRRVFKLLEDVATGKSWDIYEPLDEDGKTIKYSLRKNYKDSKFKMGLTIGVVHPFSNGKYYDEPLADIDQIVSAFEASNFKLIQKGSFADWTDKFKKFDSHWFGQLTADDKRYDTLYTYVSLVKGAK